MNTIKFSHEYYKLKEWPTYGGVQPVPFSSAILLDVIPVRLEDLSPAFLDWDTEGLYKLPEAGYYLLLLFAPPYCNQLFTTLRRDTEEKFAYYKNRIGQEFTIIIKEQQ